MMPRSLRYDAGGEIEQVQDEFVRVLRIDPELRESLRRKVAQVRGDDHIGSIADRCR